MLSPSYRYYYWPPPTHRVCLATDVMHIFFALRQTTICKKNYTLQGNGYARLVSIPSHTYCRYPRRLVTHNATLLFSEFGSFSTTSIQRTRTMGVLFVPADTRMCEYANSNFYPIKHLSHTYRFDAVLSRSRVLCDLTTHDLYYIVFVRCYANIVRWITVGNISLVMTFVQFANYLCICSWFML